MPNIQLDGLTKRFGDIEILHGISLEMSDAEFTVLVGPSGCGKSTTLRMIAGLETVSAGEIYIDGRPISHLEPKDRDLAMVFQDYALYPHMNVANNMSFALRLQKRPRKEIDARIREVADMLGLTPYLHRKPAELSGGQRQRVAMGRALTRDSSTFLFDEPLSNLDAKLRTQMRAELALMRQRVHKNMIYVTHDQIEAMTLADRIVVMHDGHIQQQGAPEELYKNPVNKFVAGFLGTPPMNFLYATIESQGDFTYLTGDGFSLRCDVPTLQRLANYTDGEICLGIRPSDLVFNPHADVTTSLSLRVDIAEYIGAQSVLICHCGNQKVMVELKSDTPITLGKQLTFSMALEDLHLFNPSNECAIPRLVDVEATRLIKTTGGNYV
ncbi:MAG: sn-glycerol-3-phosphate ABC transporter ATP-binding protein UgpC [Gammaproteobacteria bacterium]|nr:sn-glycerol-3-phosphate ABC transporter ATP-binding protein UgpC [Gammaproteobacteria bacterium]MCP4880824.1 sn-glycerol-3-phosphate ABC transporter ATP-binding protein UgpC [Gammaproteobacteria bacterium]